MATAPHHAALQEFFRWERQSWVEVAADITTDEKAHFVPVETLKSYFKGNGSRKLNKILLEVFQSEDIPVDPEVILRGHTAVFCILLRISKGRYIEDFAYFEELSDHRLPFDPAHPPAHFPEDIDDPSFLQRFCETQWMYCVPTFDDHMLHKYFGRQRLLPIVHKELCGARGDTAMYKIKLYGPHNKLILVGSEIQINNTDPNTFMIKRYLKKDEYRQEAKNFSNSKHSESIIRFHGSYTHGDSYNLLLEYADKGSLEEYFQNQTPPSRGGDVIKFWDSLFQLIKALKTIHSFLGGHQDVNPASVLVLSYGAESPFDWKFKLADFGLSHSMSKAKSEEGAIANDSRRARTYSAPECYTPSNEGGQMGKRLSKNTQAVDIWSLGCIYSEAAVWIADGYNGVVEYRRQRKAETDKMPDFKEGDCFHDGERVLKAVLETHKDIELRLRRSDYITKDVLDSMAEEMLWEEDRPGAKALLRRAEGILSRARQKLSSSATANVPSIRPSSSSNRSRTYPLPQSPPHPPPERPLPERPRVSTSRSNPAQRQSPANVEMWRTLVRVPSSELASSAYGGEPRTSPESISELDMDVASSASGWQGGNGDSLASPYTSPYTSPHVSTHFDFPRQVPGERRRGPSPSQRSSSHQRRGKRPHRQSLKDTVESSDDGLVGPSSSQLYAEFLQESVAMSSIESKGNNGPFVDNAMSGDRGSRPSSSAHTASITGPAGQGVLQPSMSLGDPPLLQSSPKRSQGFSLFPVKTTNSKPTPSTVDVSVAKAATYHDRPMTRSDSFSNNSVSTVPTNRYSAYQSGGHLSLAAVLEWKKAHKKSKKNARVPPVRGADLLEKLNDRDHVFIIDDGISMREHWHQVKTAFEALSYILKPLTPDGIELFFTVAYDAWRRHNTSELVDLLEKKGLAGDTDISYRLGLQLQDYQIKTQPTGQMASKKAKSTRPMSLYILTDGIWKDKCDPTVTIKDIADHLINADLKNEHLTIQFISFGQNAVALQRMNDIANTNFGLDLVDTTPSTGDVLKMLCGPLDKSYFQGGGNLSGAASSASTLILPLTSLPPIELA